MKIASVLVLLLLSFKPSLYALATEKVERYQLKFGSVIFNIETKFYVNIFIKENGVSNYFLVNRLEKDSKERAVIKAYQRTSREAMSRISSIEGNYKKYRSMDGEKVCYLKSSNEITSLVITESSYTVAITGSKKMIKKVLDLKNECDID